MLTQISTPTPDPIFAANQSALPRILVVGIGTAHGDDQVGLRVAEQVAEIANSAVEVRQAGSPSELLDWLDGVDQLVVCDAYQAATVPGHVACWTWPAAAIEAGRFSGSHDLSLPAVLELADHLGRLPPRVTIYGVSIVGCRPYGELSPEVAAAVPELARKVLEAIDHA